MGVPEKPDARQCLHSKPRRERTNAVQHPTNKNGEQCPPLRIHMSLSVSLVIRNLTKLALVEDVCADRCGFMEL